MLATICEWFDVGHEICGVSLSLKGKEDTISVWNKTATNEIAIQRIK